MGDKLKICVIKEIDFSDLEEALDNGRKYVKLKSRDEPYEVDEDTYDRVLAWISEMNAKRKGLKPCPFCGSTASIEVRLLEHPDWWIGCANCDGINNHICSCQMIVGASTEQAARDGIIEAWNRRVNG